MFIDETKNTFRNFYYDKKILSSITIGLIFAFLIVSAASICGSFLYQNTGYSSYFADPTIFYYIGRMLNNGAVPYKDVFDHKGLYLFYYVQLCTLWNSKIITFLVQFVFYSTTITFISLTLKENKIRIAPSLVALCIFSTIIIAASQSPSTFEIQLPFISITLFCFTKYLNSEEKRHLYIGSILAGICAGIAINIRASDAMVGFVFYLFAFIDLIRKRKIKDLFLLSLLTLSALILAVFPAYIIAYSNGFLPEMFNAAIVANFKYVSNFTHTVNFFSLISGSAIIILTISTIILLYATRNKTSKIFKLFSSIVILFILALQLCIVLYIHYLFICLPIFINFYTYTATRFEIKQKSQRIVNSVFAFCFIASLITLPLINYTVVSPRTLEIQKYVDDKISIEAKNGKTLAIDLPAAIYI